MRTPAFVLSTLLAVALAGCASPTPVPVHATMSDSRITPTTQANDLPKDYGKGIPPGEGNRMAWPVGGWIEVTNRMDLPKRDFPPTRVVIQFIVDTEGNVHDAIVVSGGADDVNLAVLRAIESSKFVPALKNGIPTNCRMRQPMQVFTGEREKKAAQPGATDNPDDAQNLREDH